MGRSASQHLRDIDPARIAVELNRSIVRKHFPKARIVADRFHVIRLIGHHFLNCWRDIDPAGDGEIGAGRRAPCSE